MSLVVHGGALDETLLDTLRRESGATAVTKLGTGLVRLEHGSSTSGFVALCEHRRIDWARDPAGRTLHDFGLYVTDMDSTLIDIECVDELARMQGVGAEVTAITESAMRGEMDFRESLVRRVGLLKGLSESVLAEVFETRLHLNPGALRLMAALREAGVYTILVSGGFTYFTKRLKAQLGFDEAHANVLEVTDGVLTGELAGPIIDAAAKAQVLRSARIRRSLHGSQVIAVGDGANDLAMLAEAGFAVAWRAKPVLRTNADCCIDEAGLDFLVDLFG